MKKRSLLVVAAGLTLISGEAGAQTQTFSTNDSQFLPGTANQGLWNTRLRVTDDSTLTRAGFWDIPNPINPLADPGRAELRSFFTFDLRGLMLGGQLPASAILRMPHGTVASSGTGETLGFYQVLTDARTVNTQSGLPPADLFADLGDGPLYATYTFTRSTPATQLIDIILGSDALADILAASGNGFFTIGMSMLPSSYSGDPSIGGIQLNPAVAGPNAFLETGAEYRANSSPSFPAAQLLVTPVPEPGTWAMMLLGFGMLGAALRRSRRTRRLPQAA